MASDLLTLLSANNLILFVIVFTRWGTFGRFAKIGKNGKALHNAAVFAQARMEDMSRYHGA